MALQYLTEDEVRKFFSVVEDKRDVLIFNLMYMLGLRVSEVVGEEVDYWTKDGKNVYKTKIPDKIIGDEVNTEIKVGKTKYYHHQYVIPGICTEDIDWYNRFLTVIGKGKKRREIPVPKGIMKLLYDYIRPETPDAMVGKVFAITRHGVNYLCKKYSDKAGIRKIHPHMFRHTHAITYLKNVGDKGLVDLQKNLGHSSLETTAQYLTMSKEDRRDNMDKVEETLNKKENVPWER